MTGRIRCKFSEENGCVATGGYGFWFWGSVRWEGKFGPDTEGEGTSPTMIATLSSFE